jgi:hypothetical protein
MDDLSLYKEAIRWLSQRETIATDALRQIKHLGDDGEDVELDDAQAIASLALKRIEQLKIAENHEMSDETDKPFQRELFFDFRITETSYGKWLVSAADQEELRVAVRVFDSPLEAAEWARKQIIEKYEKRKMQKGKEE